MRSTIIILLCTSIIHSYAQVPPTDPRFGEQWYLSMTGTPQNRADIRAVESWQITTGSSVKVAIVEQDGRPSSFHPDLLDRVIPAFGTITDHATMVAGLVGANANNSEGIAGLNWQCQIEGFPYSSIAEWPQAVLDATSAGADIINLSNGIPFSGFSFDEWIQFGHACATAYRANRILVAAMGNQGQSAIHYPAGFHGVVAVGSSTILNTQSGFSNFQNHISLIAPGGGGSGVPPGENILSTASSGYSFDWGTSFSGPLVSGASSLLLARRPDLYNDDVKRLLEISCDKVPQIENADWTPEHGYGRLNIGKALNGLDLPYELLHQSVTSGTDVGSTDWYNLTISGAPGLAPGTYSVRRHAVSRNITFVAANERRVWGRGVATEGWANASPNFAYGWCEPVPGTVTQTSATLVTFVYEVRDYITGEPYGWHPCEPSQVDFGYTLFGRRDFATPSSLTATIQDVDEIVLAWQDNSDNEMGFKIERSTDGVNFAEIGDMITNGNGSGTRTRTDDGLSQNVTYHYRVRAFAQEFTSNYSNTVQVTIPLLSAPGNVIGTGHPYHVSLVWDPVVGAQSYKVHRAISAEGPFDEVGDVSTASFYEQVPSAPQTYYYRISGRNGGYVGPQSASTIVMALHLQSMSSNATSTNSQRLVAGMGLYEAPDRYFMVYPSSGELWTNGSLDNGITWSDEMRVTDGLGTSSAPSVALWTECTPGDSPNEDCDTELYTVYRKQSGSNYNIVFTTVLPFGTGVPTSTQISSAVISTSIDTRPVVARLVEWGEYHTMWAFWQNTDGIRYNFAEYNGSAWNWIGEDLGFAGSFRNPTVSLVDLSVATPTFSLAYDNGTDVFVFNHPTYTVDGAVPASVSPTSFSPQVCADNRTTEQVHVVWEAYGGEEPPPPGTDSGDSWETDGASQRHRVMYQQWSGTQWEAAHEFRNASLDYVRPTISNLANGNLAWAWDDGSSTYKALFDGSSWAVTEVYPSSTQPNLTISGSFGPIATTRFISTSTSGAPYQLGIGSETTQPMDGPQASVVAEEYSRRVVVARKPLHRVGRLGNSLVRGDDPTDGDSLSYVRSSWRRSI